MIGIGQAAVINQLVKTTKALAELVDEQRETNRLLRLVVGEQPARR